MAASKLPHHAGLHDALLPGLETGTGPLRHLFGPVAIVAIVIVGVLLTVWLYLGPPDREISHVRPLQIASHSVSLADSAALLGYQLEDYRAGLARLDTNISLQALLVAMTVLLSVRRLRSLSLLGNSFPVSWLHIIVPVLLTYLWLSCGFTMNDLIWSRIRGVETIKAAHHSTMTEEKALFNDAGFVNGWFVSFVDQPDRPGRPGEDYSGSSHTPEGTPPGLLVTGATAVFLVLLLGTLLGATNASMLALLPIFCRRYLSGPHVLRWYYLSVVLPLAILVLSHVQFAYAGTHRNWGQLYVAALTIPFMMFLLWISAAADRTSDPDGVRWLSRQHHGVYSAVAARHPVWQGPNTADGFKTISLIGDSLSSSFYLGPRLEMLIWRWTAWKRNWFLDLGPAKLNPPSVVQRANAFGPVVGTNHACVSAMVDAGDRRSLFDRITDTLHFSHQAAEVLVGRFPDLLLIWIGHNNLDWKASTPSETPESLPDLANGFGRSYEIHLQRLLRGALANEKRVSIVVLGLMNLERFFKARAEAESRKSSDNQLYPYLELGYRYFVSLKPEYRAGMIELGHLCNQQLHGLCERLSKQLDGTTVRLVYSDALAAAPVDSADLLAPDAWHPSRLGHGVLAESVYQAVYAQAEFLGWI